MKSPTVTPLANGDWVSVQSVIAEKHFWEIIGKLKSLRGRRYPRYPD